MPAKDSEGKEREEEEGGFRVGGKTWATEEEEEEEEAVTIFLFPFFGFFWGGGSVRARSVFWRVVEYRVERPPPIGKEEELVYHPGYDTNGGDIYTV